MNNLKFENLTINRQIKQYYSSAMKTKLVLVSILLAAAPYVTGQVSAQEPRWKWAKTASDAAIHSSVTDTLGNIISVGTFSDSTMIFGNITIPGTSFGESTSMFIAKYNTAGGILWVQSIYGLNSGAQVMPVKVVVNDHGRVSVLCKISNTNNLRIGKYSLPLMNGEDKMLVISLYKTGRILWFRLLEPKSMKIPMIEGGDMAMDDAGNVYCTGNFTGDTLFAGREYIAGEDPSTFLYVARFSPLGAIDWIRTCPFESGAGYTQIYSRFITLALTGIYIAGDYTGDRKYYFNNGTLAGDTSTSAFVAKVSYTGDFIWAKSFGGNLTDFMDGLATDNVGNAYVTGIYNSFLLTAEPFSLTNFSGAYNMFVSKIDPEGGILWLNNIDIQLTAYGSPGRNCFLKTDILGNITLVTHYMGASVLSNIFTRPNAKEGTRDLLALRLESGDGSIHWVHTGNSINDDWISSVAFDRLGSTYILGDILTDMVYDTIAFNDATGNGGFYLIKISYTGEINFGKANLNLGAGHLYGQKICADAFGNLYLQGNFSGTDNVLDDISVASVRTSGLFTSKFSYATNITGRVTNDDGTAMPSGMVKVYGFTRFQRSPLSDSAAIGANGEYLLKNIPYGRYIIYAIPDNAFNPDAVPTYFHSGTNWQDAEPILIASTEPRTGIDILLKETPQNAGTATLGGLVFEADTTHVFKSSDAVQAKPVKKANVVLVGKTKVYENVIAFTETDDYGNFSFYNIFDGGYTIIVDIPGMPHNSYYDVNVTGGQLIMNLDHLVGEEEIEALYGTSAVPENKDKTEDIAVYPNPCSGTLFIHHLNAGSEELQLEILSLSGALLYKTSLNPQREVITLDVRMLQKGIYLLRIHGGVISRNMKLLVY